MTASKMLDLQQLRAHAHELRFRIIRNSHKTGTPHLGTCLSCTDILTALYFSFLRVNPDNSKDPARDRFILSKGHGAPALFQVLAMRGIFPAKMLDDYGQNGSLFGEHPPTPDHLAGIEAATGSLGHGLPIGLGMAMAGRIHQLDYRVVVLLGDGECNEGSIWESAMLAAAQKVKNLCVIVDYNKWQATGRSEEIMALAPMADKWRAFGWNCAEIDGHDIPAILGSLQNFARQDQDRPTALIAHTVKGSGVTFMEDDNNWHYRIPTAAEVEAAGIELGIKS